MTIKLQNYEIERQNEVLYYITVPFSQDFPLLKVNFDTDSAEVEAGGTRYTVNDLLVSDNGEWINLVCDRINEVVAREKRERHRIGQRIADLRKEHGMTQQDLAAKTGLQRNHISRIESGKYSVGFDTLQLIAEQFGMKVDIR